MRQSIHRSIVTTVTAVVKVTDGLMLDALFVAVTIPANVRLVLILAEELRPY
jgi:hypothetical protein